MYIEKGLLSAIKVLPSWMLLINNRLVSLTALNSKILTFYEKSDKVERTQIRQSELPFLDLANHFIEPSDTEDNYYGHTQEAKVLKPLSALEEPLVNIFFKGLGS